MIITHHHIMNVFVTEPCPYNSARVLPDKHIVKMPLETCQMLSMVYSKWYFDWGQLTKKDGTPYKTEKGAFRGHPCTIWAAENIYNTAWLIAHGFGLSREYYERYGKVHTCLEPLVESKKIFEEKTGENVAIYCHAKNFPRAMPEEWKYDDNIDTFTAYKRYIASKPWAATNYLRIPDRKPDWIS